MIKKPVRYVALKREESSPQDHGAEQTAHDVGLQAIAMREVNREEAPDDDIEHRPIDQVGDAIEIAPRLVEMPYDHGVDAMCLHAALPFTTRRKTSSSAGTSRSSSRIACVISIGLPAAITFP